MFTKSNAAITPRVDKHTKVWYCWLTITPYTHTDSSRDPPCDSLPDSWLNGHQAGSNFVLQQVTHAQLILLKLKLGSAFVYNYLYVNFSGQFRRWPEVGPGIFWEDEKWATTATSHAGCRAAAESGCRRCGRYSGNFKTTMWLMICC